MEAKKNNQSCDHSCEACCRTRHGNWIFRIAKFVIILGVLAVVFTCGATLGAVSGRTHQPRVASGIATDGFGGMMGGVGAPAQNAMYRGGWGMMANVQGASRVFGVIAKIDGNKITVTDNGGQEQVVLSGSDTVITSATNTEMVLASLKAGQTISAFGTVNQDKQLLARFVQVAAQ